LLHPDFQLAPKLSNKKPLHDLWGCVTAIFIASGLELIIPSQGKYYAQPWKELADWAFP